MLGSLEGSSCEPAQTGTDGEAFVRTLRQYILREFFISFVPIVLLLTSFLLFGRTIIEVINRDVPIVAIGRVGVWLIPEVFGYTIPMGFLLACLMSFGRLASDHEILAIRAAGIHILYLCLPINLLGLCISLVLIGMNATFLPHLKHRSKLEAIRMAALYPAYILPEGEWLDVFDDLRLLVERKDPKTNRLFNVKIEKEDEGGRLIIIQAVSAEIRGSLQGRDLQIIMNEVTITQDVDGDEHSIYKGDFRTWKQRLSVEEVMRKEVEFRPGDMNIFELADRVKHYEKYEESERGRDRHQIFRCELHEKFSRPFSVFIFALVGVPLAISARTGGRATSFGFGFVIFAVYYLLMLPGQTLAEDGKIPAYIGMWISNLILASVGLALNKKIATE